VTVVDGVDEAAQLQLYSVADWQPMQLNQGRRVVPKCDEKINTVEGGASPCCTTVGRQRGVVVSVVGLVTEVNQCFNLVGWPSTDG